MEKNIIINPLNKKSNLNYIEWLSSCLSELASLPLRKTSQLKIYRKNVAVCSENRAKHINEICG